MESIIIRHLKAVSDPGRLRILTLISVSEELCVCEIEQIMGMTPSTASRGLKELEAAGWLRSRRVGRWIYYRLADLDPDWTEVKNSILRTAAGDPAVKAMLKLRYEILASGRRACDARPESLETLYEQIDHERP